MREKGRKVYASNCTTCHNADPTKPGPLGPALAGSTEQLIERRVMYGDYPQGYKPQRETHIMVALPYLKNDLPALHAFLNSVK